MQFLRWPFQALLGPAIAPSPVVTNERQLESTAGRLSNPQGLLAFQSLSVSAQREYIPVIGTHESLDSSGNSASSGDSKDMTVVIGKHDHSQA